MQTKVQSYLCSRGKFTGLPYFTNHRGQLHREANLFVAFFIIYATHTEILSCIVSNENGYTRIGIILKIRMRIKMRRIVKNGIDITPEKYHQ